MGEIIKISGLTVYSLGFFSAISFLWGAFIFYKKTSETHLEEDRILDLIAISGFWGFLIGRVGFVILNYSTFVKHWTRVLMITSYPGLDRWFVLLGFVLALIVGLKKERSKYFDYLDKFSLAFVAGSGVFWAFLSLIFFEWQRAVIGLLFVIATFWLWKLENQYRFFDWYKGNKNSARPGFVTAVGFSIVGLAFIFELVIYKSSFLFSYVFGFLIFVVGLFLLYIRSGRVLVEDLYFLKKWKKTK